MLRFPIYAFGFGLLPLTGILLQNIIAVVGLSAVGIIYAIIYLAQTIAETNKQ